MGHLPHEENQDQLCYWNYVDPTTLNSMTVLYQAWSSSRGQGCYSSIMLGTDILSLPETFD